MSTPAKPAPATPVDVRAYHPLARLRRIIRVYVTLEGLLTSLLFVVLWFWAALALDAGLHYLFKIDLAARAPQLRYVLVIVFSGLALGALVFYVLQRSFRFFSSASLALLLEKRFPELLGDRLITAVELANLQKAAKQGYSTEMILQTMKEAQERVNQIPVRKVFNWGRLALLVWLLFGVSGFILLLSYPITMLFSLLYAQPGETAYRMLALNGLILLSCLFLFAVPFVSYFTWRRHRQNVLILLGVSVVCLGLTAYAYDLGLRHSNTMRLNEYSWRFYHAADITLERNLMFKNTRWPADDYQLDLLDFPVAEKRIESGKYLTVRAYFCRWIVADKDKLAAPTGWRPVRWTDLATLLPGETIPELPLERIHEYIVRLTDGLENSPVGYDKGALQLPGHDDIKVDLALAALTDRMLDPPLFTKQEQDQFDALAGKLSRRAADPRLGGRILRKVEPPEQLQFVATMNTTSRRQRGDMKNVDDRKFVYQLNKPIQLEESITFYVEAPIANNPRTAERTVILVLPPYLQSLTYQEFRPAYFYYLPPEGPRGETIDQRRKLLSAFRQPLRLFRTERPPEQMVISISEGSEVVLTGFSDKPLQDAALVPLNKEFPGNSDKDALEPIHLQLNPDRHSFTVRFAKDGQPIRTWLAHEWLGHLPPFFRPNSWYEKEFLAGLPMPPSWAGPRLDAPIFPLIARTTDFELIFKDTDNMSSSRAIKVKPESDKLPEVNLYIDIIRRVQNRYMCTARAAIPFAKESYVTDDHGLHKVELTYDYFPLANETLVSLRARDAAWLWASSPLVPSIGDFLYRREVLLHTVSGQKTGAEVVKGAFPLPSFERELKRFAGDAYPTLEQLRQATTQPLPDGFSKQVLNRFEFKNEDKPEVFDLQLLLPRLADVDPITKAQPQYEMTVNVRATDSNVLAAADRTAENKEAPLVFRIVPEHVLFEVISREENQLALKFDGVIKTLEAAQKNLQGSASRLPSLSLETATSEFTRLESILEAVTKAHELTGEIGGDYKRILTEYEVNRFKKELSSGLRTKIVEPLQEVQGKEYPQAEDALSKFHAALKTGNSQQAGPLAAPTLESMDQLLRRLLEIRRNMGETFSLNNAIVKFQTLLKEQTQLSKDDLEKIYQDLIDKLFNIQVTAPTINLAAGKTEKVTLAIQMPENTIGDGILQFDIPAESGLKINPKEVKLADDAKEASFEITAGNVPGTYAFQIIPSLGKKKPVDVKVVVK